MSRVVPAQWEIPTVLLTALVAFLPAPASARDQASPAPVVVQGAMPAETERLVVHLGPVAAEQVGGWSFWRGSVDDYPVVVSKTLKGVANAAAATLLAVERYRPVAIINQGTSGGHDPDLHLYDIVLGTSSVSLGAFRSPYRPRGAGSNPLDWRPLDLMASQGSAGNDPNARRVARFPADEALLAAARSVSEEHAKGRVVEGVIGSSDMWIDELDLVARFHSEYGTSVEDMETASAAQIASLMNVPFLGIRIVSDNVTNGTAYDRSTAEACQDYVYEVVRAYVRTLKRTKAAAGR
jgi:adenosylhomocysteine nucleosidase